MAGMKAKHRVQLSERQRQDFTKRIASGHGSARELTHIWIILKADEGLGGPGWRDTEIARALARPGRDRAHRRPREPAREEQRRRGLEHPPPGPPGLRVAVG